MGTSDGVAFVEIELLQLAIDFDISLPLQEPVPPQRGF